MQVEGQPSREHSRRASHSATSQQYQRLHPDLEQNPRNQPLGHTTQGEISYSHNTHHVHSLCDKKCVRALGCDDAARRPCIIRTSRGGDAQQMQFVQPCSRIVTESPQLWSTEAASCCWIHTSKKAPPSQITARGTNTDADRGKRPLRAAQSPPLAASPCRLFAGRASWPSTCHAALTGGSQATQPSLCCLSESIPGVVFCNRLAVGSEVVLVRVVALVAVAWGLVAVAVLVVLAVVVLGLVLGRLIFTVILILVLGVVLCV